MTELNVDLCYFWHQSLNVLRHRVPQVFSSVWLLKTYAAYMTFQFFYTHTHIFILYTLSLSVCIVYTYPFIFSFCQVLVICQVPQNLLKFMYSLSSVSIHVITKFFHAFNTDNKKCFWATKQHIRIFRLCFQHCKSSHSVSCVSLQHSTVCKYLN